MYHDQLQPLLLGARNFLAGNTAWVSRLQYEMHRDRRSLTSRDTAFVVVQPVSLISFWVCRGENRGFVVGAPAHFHLRVECPLLAGFNAGHRLLGIS